MMKIINVKEKLEREYKIKSKDETGYEDDLTCVCKYNFEQKEWELRLPASSAFITLEESKEITKILQKLNNLTNK